MSAMFAYPKQAEFGRVLPKNKIYEHSGANTRLKDLFVEQVDQIVWRYKLAPETINLAAKPGVPEIQIFAIQLKTTELHRDVLRCIDGAVPFPIIFELTHVQGAAARTRAVAAYKRPSETNVESWVSSEYFESDWESAPNERKPLPIAIDLSGLYELLIHALVPIKSRPQEALSALLARVDQIEVKRREVALLKGKLSREKQFNRKVAINSSLRQLEAELVQLCHQ